MLVKKVFDRSKRLRRRKWRLQRFDGADDLETESVTRSVTALIDLETISQNEPNLQSDPNPQNI